MDKKFVVTLIFVINITIIVGQDLNWNNISNDYDLPEAVQIFKAERDQPALEIYYLDVDLNDENIVVRPYITNSSANVKSLTKNFGAYAAINGGFFGGSVSYSSVIYPNEVKAQNVGALTRNNKSYPVLRSLFSLSEDFIPSVNWIYHFSGDLSGLYSFNSPLPYSYNDQEPLSIPEQAEGTQMENVLTGIGGGPTLVKAGEKHITYNEEIFWGSGVGRDNPDPRTAVGYTADNHIIMVVADGRQDISEGIGLGELAEIMIDLGCQEAMNLDGGGSTQMAVPNQNINSPSENRAVPTILAVTHRDSLNTSDTLGYEKIIDTEDEQCSLIGDWFETANPGYYGDTPSQLSQKGPGNDMAAYHLDLEEDKKYQIFAWWVAASNRCKDTPYVVVFQRGRDTIRVDQTKNHASWNYLGEYSFSPDRDSIIISDAAKSGDYVVADAIALKPISTKITTNKRLNKSSTFSLVRNFPNPFNNNTKIEFRVNYSTQIELNIYNINGKKVQNLIRNKNFKKGYHTIVFNAKNLASGIYFYTLKSKNESVRNKMLLIK